MKKKLSITVIIPVYKKTDMFLKIFSNNWKYIKDFETIIVDDASKENLQEKLKKLFPSVTCIVNQENLGFGSSMNKAINQANGDYLLFLNSDVVLQDRSFLKSLYILNKNKSLFAVSFAQKEDEKIVGKNKIFWKKGLYQHSKAGNTESGYSSWAEGGACMARTEHVKELGGFDERFSPFYGEDIDLSLRALQRGWKVWFESKIQVIHNHQTTIGAFFNQAYIEEIALRNQVLYSWKNSSFTQKLLMVLFIFYYIPLFSLKRKMFLLKGYLKGWKLIIKKI